MLDEDSISITMVRFAEVNNKLVLVSALHGAREDVILFYFSREGTVAVFKVNIIVKEIILNSFANGYLL